MSDAPAASKGGGGKLLVGGSVVVGALIFYGLYAYFTAGGESEQVRPERSVVEVRADAPVDQAAAGTDVAFVSTPVEASRYINAVPTPVNIPATGHSERFPVSRTHRTCPSEFEQEFGYRTICHRRGTPDGVTSVYDEDDRDSCPNTDWIAYESTDGRAKQMELNYVRDAETCPV